MQTYKWTLNAHGKPGIANDEFLHAFEHELEFSSKLGRWPLRFLDAFQCRCCLVDHVSINTGKDGSIESIDIHSFQNLDKESMDSDFYRKTSDMIKDMVQSHIDCVLQQMNTREGSIQIDKDSEIEISGQEGMIPKKLYHITDRKHLDSIMKNGLIPTGKHDKYDTYSADSVLLCEENDIAPWLCMIRNIDDPVILEVNTENNPNIRQGRIFNDREYFVENRGRYGEYIADTTIPSVSLKEVSTGKEFDDFIRELDKRIIRQHNIEKQIPSFPPTRYFMETMDGLKRLGQMGFLSNKQVFAQLGSDDLFPDDSFKEFRKRKEKIKMELERVTIDNQSKQMNNKQNIHASSNKLADSMRKGDGSPELADAGMIVITFDPRVQLEGTSAANRPFIEPTKEDNVASVLRKSSDMIQDAMDDYFGIDEDDKSQRIFISHEVNKTPSGQTAKCTVTYCGYESENEGEVQDFLINQIGHTVDNRVLMDFDGPYPVTENMLEGQKTAEKKRKINDRKYESVDINQYIWHTASSNGTKASLNESLVSQCNEDIGPNGPQLE